MNIRNLPKGCNPVSQAWIGRIKAVNFMGC